MPLFNNKGNKQNAQAKLKSELAETQKENEWLHKEKIMQECRADQLTNILESFETSETHEILMEKALQLAEVMTEVDYLRNQMKKMEKARENEIAKVNKLNSVVKSLQNLMRNDDDDIDYCDTDDDMDDADVDDVRLSAEKAVDMTLRYLKIQVERLTEQKEELAQQVKDRDKQIKYLKTENELNRSKVEMLGEMFGRPASKEHTRAETDPPFQNISAPDLMSKARFLARMKDDDETAATAAIHDGSYRYVEDTSTASPQETTTNPRSFPIPPRGPPGRSLRRSLSDPTIDLGDDDDFRYDAGGTVVSDDGAHWEERDVPKAAGKKVMSKAMMMSGRSSPGAQSKNGNEIWWNSSSTEKNGTFASPLMANFNRREALKSHGSFRSSSPSPNRRDDLRKSSSESKKSPLKKSRSFNGMYGLDSDEVVTKEKSKSSGPLGGVRKLAKGTTNVVKKSGALTTNLVINSGNATKNLVINSGKLTKNMVIKSGDVTKNLVSKSGNNLRELMPRGKRSESPKTDWNNMTLEQKKKFLLKSQGTTSSSLSKSNQESSSSCHSLRRSGSSKSLTLDLRAESLLKDLDEFG